MAKSMRKSRQLAQIAVFLINGRAFTATRSEMAKQLKFGTITTNALTFAKESQGFTLSNERKSVTKSINQSWNR
jgi:hypothetical protein